MEVRVYKNIKIDLSKSCLKQIIPEPLLDRIVNVNGVGVFDDNGKVLPLISEYLSYQAKHEKIAIKSAATYGKNLTYFLNYLRLRPEYEYDESDEVFTTIPGYLIQEYLTHLAQNEFKSSSTLRNRDATIRAFIEFLCSHTEDREPLRDNNPYTNGYLSKAPKKTPIISCTFDELFELIKSTNCERERILLQFLYDSGLRRSEVPRVTLQDFREAYNSSSGNLTAHDPELPIHTNYYPLKVRGSKGRGNQIKPRWAIIASYTLKRIQKYHSSPLYKKHIRKHMDPNETPAFLNAQGSTYTPASINKLLERVSKRAIKQGRLNKMISPHKLRHGNAYAILQSNDLGRDYLDRLVIVQKNLGHTDLDTTQMYTSIPQDIYNDMCSQGNELLTRAEKMKRLVELTQLRIRINDKK